MDSLSELGVHAIPGVDNSGSLLDDAECFNERGRQALCRAANVEVLERPGRNVVSSLADARPKMTQPLSLSAPVAINRNLKVTKSVALDTVLLRALLRSVS